MSIDNKSKNDESHGMKKKYVRCPQKSIIQPIMRKRVPRRPAPTGIMELEAKASAPAVKLSGGPKAPLELDAPGLGAPPEASPPPSTLCVAVGSGDWDVDEVEVEFPDVLFPDELLLEPVVVAGGAVTVLRTVTSDVVCW